MFNLWFPQLYDGPKQHTSCGNHTENPELWPFLGWWHAGCYPLMRVTGTWSWPWGPGAPWSWAMTSCWCMEVFSTYNTLTYGGLIGIPPCGKLRHSYVPKLILMLWGDTWRSNTASFGPIAAVPHLCDYLWPVGPQLRAFWEGWVLASWTRQPWPFLLPSPWLECECTLWFCEEEGEGIQMRAGRRKRLMRPWVSKS